MALSAPIGSSLPFSSSSALCPRRRPLLHLLRQPYCNRPLSLRVSSSISDSQNTNPNAVSKSLHVKPLESVRFDRLLTSSTEEEMGEGFFEAIEELERMVRDPSDVLGELVERLSARELQLVLVYFAQEGRDSYCALEVFDWLRKENRVDAETMELMVSIACGWIERLIGGEHAPEDVMTLLNEMECVGLDPGFSMVEKVVSLYWDRGKEDEAIAFVKDVLKRGGIGGYKIEEGHEGERGGPVGYLVWKMMVDGDYLGAVKLVIEFKENGLKPEVYSYLIALTALVKEQKEFSKALRKLKVSIKAGLINALDAENLGNIEKYQSALIRNGILLSDWALQEGSSAISGVVHERLLALYTCAGFGREAEQQLWLMKLSGKEPDRELYDAVLAICASQKEAGAVGRLLAGVEIMSVGLRKKTLSWLLRGYVKGGFYVDASETLIKMLNLGISPEYLDRAAVLQGLRKNIQESGNIEPYIKLCKHLSDKDLVGPCLLYMYRHKYKLWILKML
ncbi:pentatricopeptide repeat-containing protein At2g30100, chloroplastic-like [Musa acuminata AAA Group]|uniref:pentatricopeptide repeat-containing protein At2g30100, chloroplastic-like n=1 Tax=Musa acuminata AAA Group TaxID=214697 RepID=UPI0031D2A6A7